MRANRKFVFIVLAAVVIAFAIFATLNSKDEPVEKQVNRASPEMLYAEHAPKLGTDEAEVKIVEFLDPECEACRAMYPIVKTLMMEYPGRVQLIVRYMPFHRNSMLAAKSLEFAREQDRYWEALEVLFQRQPEWGDHHSPKPELIRAYLGDMGLDQKALDKYVKDASHDWRILKDQEAGRALGVQGTPTFFVNGRMLHEIGYEALRAAIAKELKK